MPAAGSFPSQVTSAIVWLNDRAPSTGVDHGLIPVAKQLRFRPQGPAHTAAPPARTTVTDP
ncbi:hypothetical protein [Streptomyces sp. NPDC058623]|uniref:hypothetical protein n=1 Tax=Streptomyces sp. NPDC058623 TaxID=3346563 RepID=UPI00365065C1